MSVLLHLHANVTASLICTITLFIYSSTLVD